MSKYIPMSESERKTKQTQDIVSQISKGNFAPEVLALGEPVTQFEPMGMNGAARVELNADSLDLLVGFPDPTKEEVDSLFDNMDISLFVYNHVPFLILHTDKFTVDMNINIRKMKPEYIDDWLESKSKTVRIIFVNAVDMTLVGLRSIQLPLMKQVRETLREEVGYEMYEIDDFINMAMTMYSTQDMLKSAKVKNKFGHCGEFDFLKDSSGTSDDNSEVDGSKSKEKQGNDDLDNSQSSWHYLIFEIIFQIVIVLLFVFLPKVLGLMALPWGAFLLVQSLRFMKDTRKKNSTILVNAFNGFMIVIFGISMLVNIDLLKVISLGLISFMLLVATIYEAVTKKEQTFVSIISFVVTFATCGYMIYRIV